MLSAKKEDRAFQEALHSSRAANSDSVGKMLDSIQDLQQHLREITLEEITEAEEKAKKLLQKLSVLQKNLETFDEIKKRFTSVTTVVGISAEERFHSTKIALLDKQQSLNVAIPHPSNLIPFPGPHRTSKVSEDSSQPITNLSHQELSQAQESEQEIRAAVLPSAVEPEENVAHGNAKPATIEAQTPAVTANYENSIEKPQETIVNVDSDSALSETDRQDQTPEPEFSIEEKAEFGSSNPAAPDGIGHSFEFENRRQEIEELHPALDININLDSPQLDNTHDDRIEFDQRLLDDLIKDYGEFVTYSNLSQAPGAPKPLAQPQAQMSPEVIEPEIAEETTNDKAVARYRAEGDLDRQLKKLIKDYGEYDLYPQRNSEYLKRGVIIAFLMLGLIFTAFYFGFPRQTTRPATNISVVESNSDSTNPSLHRNSQSFSDAPKSVNNATPSPFASPAVSDSRKSDLVGSKMLPERKE